MSGSRRVGLTLIEMLVYVIVSAIVLTTVTMLFAQFQAIYHRTETTLSRLETASRWLDEVKRDLRRADRVSIIDGGSGLALEFAGGRTRRYGFKPVTGDVVTDDGRAWFDVFERVTFARLGSVVGLDVELRRSERRATYAPLISTRVRCRGRLE